MKDVILWSAVFGPGILIVATVLTLLALPAMYAAWFRVNRDERNPAVEAEEALVRV